MASWLICPLIITLSHSEMFQIQRGTVEGPMGRGRGADKAQPQSNVL